MTYESPSIAIVIRHYHHHECSFDPNRAKVGPAVSCLKPLQSRSVGHVSRQDFAVHFPFRLSKSHQ